MSVNWVKFGTDLKRTRQGANLSLRAAAEQSGIHYATLSRTERGKYISMGAAQYLSLCRWMDVDPFKYFKP